MYLSSAERRLPKAQKDQLYNDFNSHIRNNANVDQYKYALYKIVGRLELSRKTLKIATTTEDWMWLQLSLVREVRDDSPQEQYDLIDLAKMVAKYGNEKFDAGGTRPFSWFNLLLLTAQFEKVGFRLLFTLVMAYKSPRLSHTYTRRLLYGPTQFTSLPRSRITASSVFLLEPMTATSVRLSHAAPSPLKCCSDDGRSR